MPKKLDPIHPGDILLEDFMEPLGLTQYRVATDIGVPPIRISQIVRRKPAVTADTALRLARYLNTSPQLWMRLQAQDDLEQAARTSESEINATVAQLQPTA